MASGKTVIANAHNLNETDLKFNLDETKMLYSVITHLEGLIDFKAVATDIGAANAEAAYVYLWIYSFSWLIWYICSRKRFKRFLAKENITTTIQGNHIGRQSQKDSGGITKSVFTTPEKAGKAKTTRKINHPNLIGELGASTLSTKKRKANQLLENNEKTGTEEEIESKVGKMAKTEDED